MIFWMLSYRIETKSRSLPHGVRSTVFGHLAKVLSCEKETLIKRAKRVFLAQHDEKLRRPIALLKEGMNLEFLIAFADFIGLFVCN